MRVLDLTQALDERTVLWPDSAPFRADAQPEYDVDGFWWRDLSFAEHSGTHIDAPSHACRAARWSPTSPPSCSCARRCGSTRARSAAGTPRGCSAPPTSRRGRPSTGACRPAPRCCCARAGTRSAATRRATSAIRWTSRATAATAAALLVDRAAAGLGIDTLSVDAGAAADFPVHHTTLRAGLWHLEGLVGLDAVPATGATLVVGALKLPGASGTPARVFALVP